MEELKNTGVFYLPRIPRSWTCTRLGHVCSKLQRPCNETDATLICTNKGTVVPRHGKSMGQTSDKIEMFQGVAEGDLLIHGMDTWHGAIAVSSLRGKCSNVVHVCSSVQSRRFVAYFMRALAFHGLYKAISNGVRENTSDFRSWAKARTIYVAFPSYAEQNRIAAYLDAKTSAIDALAERREQVIAHLQELKQSIIAHAVTKGLNPDGPTKDSGVPWLGQVPAHWQPVRTKQLLVQVKKRAGESHASLPLLSLTKQGVILRDVESGKGKFSEDMSRFWCVEPGNFIFCHFDVQETPRTVGISAHRGMITGAYAIYRYNGEVPSFFYYLHEFLDDGKRLRSLYTGLRNVIKKERFLSMPVFMPSVEEQQAIVAYLDAKCAAIDELMARHRAMIERLKELKTSLIAAAVTGKIDVR